VRKVKPEAAIFERALSRFQAKAADCLFLDDHAPNVKAARDLGWQALQFTDAGATRRELQALGVL
jgi:putative hydrolase of the HAD superfamily